MKLKIYSQKSCQYCNAVKEALTTAEIEFELIDIEENKELWNHITRITGLGLTPTIDFEGEYWLPTRDFRTKEELVNRIKFFEENPVGELNEEEKRQQIINHIKNVTLGINGINQSLTQMMQKIIENSNANTLMNKPRMEQTPSNTPLRARNVNLPRTEPLKDIKLQ